MSLNVASDLTVELPPHALEDITAEVRRRLAALGEEDPQSEYVTSSQAANLLCRSSHSVHCLPYNCTNSEGAMRRFLVARDGNVEKALLVRN